MPHRAMAPKREYYGYRYPSELALEYRNERVKKFKETTKCPPN